MSANKDKILFSAELIIKLELIDHNFSSLSKTVKHCVMYDCKHMPTQGNFIQCNYSNLHIKLHPNDAISCYR